MALYELSAQLSNNNDSTHRLRIAAPLAATTAAVRRCSHKSGTSLLTNDALSIANANMASDRPNNFTNQLKKCHVVAVPTSELELAHSLTT